MKQLASLLLLILLTILHDCLASNSTLEDGSTYLGDLDANNLPSGFGKLIKLNGDVFE